MLYLFPHLFSCLFLYPQFTFYLKAMFIVLYPNSKTFDSSLLILRIYILLRFKDLHYFFFPPLTKALLLNNADIPETYHLNPSNQS